MIEVIEIMKRSSQLENTFSRHVMSEKRKTKYCLSLSTVNSWRNGINFTKQIFSKMHCTKADVLKTKVGQEWPAFCNVKFLTSSTM